MFRRLITTPNDYALLVVRLALAAVMLGHGLQKALGWWGGYGFSATVGFFASLGIPKPLGVVVILGETVGAIALALGLLGRFTAFGMAATLLGAVVMVHGQHGFFMNWSGTGTGEGYEFHLLGIAMAVAIIIRGSGALSLDRLLQRRLSLREEASTADVPGRLAVAA